MNDDGLPEEELLNKMDALLRRHRPGAFTPDPGAGGEIPVLTEVVAEHGPLSSAPGPAAIEPVMQPGVADLELLVERVLRGEASAIVRAVHQRLEARLSERLARVVDELVDAVVSETRSEILLRLQDRIDQAATTATGSKARTGS